MQISLHSLTVFCLVLAVQADQFSDILSYKVMRYSECGTLLSTCQPTIATCASIVCSQCTDLGQTVINNCCSASNPLACFISGASAHPATATSDLQYFPTGTAVASGGSTITSAASASTGVSTTSAKSAGVAASSFSISQKWEFAFGILATAVLAMMVVL